MKFKPFYIHEQVAAGGTNKRGFTAYIAPGKKKRECHIQISMCSTKDQFCKKTGREEAHKAVVLTCNPRQIAKVLSEAYVFCVYGAAQNADWAEHRYFYVYKYMI
jgi:hypothetical protein